MQPVKIDVEDGYFIVGWNDESVSKIKLANLRKNCPCAVCAEDRESRGSTYIPIYTRDQLRIENINLMGKYAINIVWKDGHSSGIYEYTTLKNFSQESK